MFAYTDSDTARVIEEAVAWLVAVRARPGRVIWSQGVGAGELGR